jgi:uncharacterized membrane protein YfcA
VIVWAVPAGLVVGLALGGLGGGGSTLALPALVYLLDQSTAAATTGSLVIVGVSALIGAVSHYRAGHVRLATGAGFGALGVGGSYAGSRLSVLVSDDLLLTAFAGLMLLVASLMLYRSANGGGAGHEQTTGGARQVGRVVVAATGVGLLTGFFGVGGGFAAVPALTLVLGFDMPTAVGTSLLIIAINSGSALGSRLASGMELDWTVLAVFSALAVIGSLAGARFARRADPTRLTGAFAALLIILAVYIGATSIVHLI